MPRPGWSPARIIAAVKRFRRRHGRLPRNGDWRGPDLPAPATMRAAFGSQEACFVAAGLARPRTAFATRADAITVLRAAAASAGTGTRLAICDYDEYAGEQGLPHWRAVLSAMRMSKWATALRAADLAPGSSRNVTSEDVKAIVRPVVEAWLLNPDHLRGLGDEIDAALEQHGLSVSVLKARMAEETGEPATEDNARIVLWLGLLPPTSKSLQERVLELAQALGRGPNSQELEDHGLYVYRNWASLDEMYVELALAPPTNLFRSLTHYVSYVSQFERRTAEILAAELEAGRINWVMRRRRSDPVRRYTADFLVFTNKAWSSSRPTGTG